MYLNILLNAIRKLITISGAEGVNKLFITPTILSKSLFITHQ